MRKLRSALCALCLLLLIPGLLLARQRLPQDSHALVEKKYDGWTGVLRLWVYEGWTPGAGSLSSWLNRCIASFERAHGGVYVQPQYVDANAIRTFGGSGILPPDMLLLPPGLLTSPEGLLAMEAPSALRAPLAQTGVWNGRCFASPVAMGGYLWAYNAAQLSGIPGTWAGGSATIAAPESEDWRCWGGALLGLCSGRYAEAETEAAQKELWAGDVDLGLLPSQRTPAPTPSPAPDDADTLPCRLPEDFAFSASAWRDFINGDGTAMPVTQREIRRLQALSDQGKGPDWRLAQSGAAFTDQVLSLAIVDRPDAQAQQALCRAFLDHLLDDACQGELHRAGAFSVTDAASGYGASDPLSLMESVLRDPGLATPNSFDAAWRDAADDAIGRYIDGNDEASRLWPQLAARLRQGPREH